MDLRKLGPGELIAGAAGAALLAVMLLPWYDRVSAWRTFELLDFLLALTAVAAIGAAVVVGTQRSAALPIAASVTVTWLGTVASLAVLYRLLDAPGSDRLVDVRIWAYAGLALSVAIACGGYLSMQEEGATRA